MIAALQAALDAHRDRAGAARRAARRRGPHFSFGASVEEHLAERCAAMLAALHALVLTLAGYPVPVLVAVRGQCLGGGLEVALAGGPIFAAPDARFGQPEIKLGVFAPAASCCCPGACRRWRRGPAVVGPQHRRRPPRWRSAWCRCWPTTPRPRRWPGSTSTWRRSVRAALAMRCWPRARRALRELRQRLAEVERCTWSD
jgi:hypothetical protein